MTKKDLMKQLKSEGKAILPNKARILSQIPRQDEKKRVTTWHPKLAIAFSLLLLIVIGITLFNEQPMSPTVITVDINPSVELTIDANEKVTSYRALNLDGEVVVESIHLNGLSMTAAIETIMLEATELGYMNETSVVNVLAVNNQSSVENKINDRLKSYFANRIQMIDVTSDIIRQAKDLNISPRKLVLIQSIIEMDPTYTLDALISLDISMLNEIKRDYVRAELDELKDAIADYKDDILNQKNALLSDVSDYIDGLRTSITQLKSLYETNVVEFSIAYTNFSLEKFPSAEIPLLPSLKYQRLVLLESKLDAYESYLNNQVESLYEVHMRGLYAHLVDTHANLLELSNWVLPNQGLSALTSLEIYLDASLYDQLFIAVAKRLDTMLNQTPQGSGEVYRRTLLMTYQEFMVYYESNQVSEALKTSEYIQNILTKYQQKEN